MRKLIALLAAAMLILTAFAQAEEGQQAPDYLLEGFDDANHDWENNLFFQRMQEETGISFMFREHTDKDEWQSRKKAIADGEDLPDVLFKAQLTMSETRDMAESGILIDLKPYLEEYAPDLWSLLQDNQAYLEAITLHKSTQKK